MNGDKNRRQKPEESIRDFSYTLNELMEKSERVKPQDVKKSVNKKPVLTVLDAESDVTQ